MNLRKFCLAPITAALALSFVPAVQAQSAGCALPGELLLEDATGDTGPTTPGGQVPVPSEAHDIVSVHAAEATSDKLTFTYKIASLATVPPQTAYILRFQTDLPPDNGDEDYFVAMLTTPDGGARFVHGTDGFAAGAPAGEPRQFRIAGDLDASSSFNADGTITLVLDKAAVPGLDVGMFMFNILPTTRLVTPADAPAPFFTNADNSTIVDDVAGSGFYEVTGGCGGGKSGILGAGGLPLALLIPFGLGGLWRRLRRGA